MIAKQFLEGSGLIDSNLALTVEIPDVRKIIDDPECERIIHNNYNVTYRNGYYAISNHEREVIFINEEDLCIIENQLSNSCLKRLIIIFRPRKNISDRTKTIMTQNCISLLDLPIPKLENEYAKSIINTNDYGKYLDRSYDTPQIKFWYDLFIGILSNVIASFFKF